jgi:hypothetical protein
LIGAQKSCWDFCSTKSEKRGFHFSHGSSTQLAVSDPGAHAGAVTIDPGAFLRRDYRIVDPGAPSGAR